MAGGRSMPDFEMGAENIFALNRPELSRDSASALDRDMMHTWSV